MNRFYHPERLEINQNIYLDDTSAHHALQVMRVKTNDRFIVFNGDGFDYLAEVIEIEKRKLKLHVLSRSINATESPVKVTLVQSLSSNEKMDWIIQKATELGVNHILPIYSTRSIIKLDTARAEKKLMHWQQVAVSACEQSGRAKVPEIHQPISFIKALQLSMLNKNTLKIILAPNGSASFESLPPLNHQDIVLLIGPEGGFSEEEITLARNHLYIALKLGPRVLRTETAPLSILSIIQYRYGDLS